MVISVAGSSMVRRICTMNMPTAAPMAMPNSGSSTKDIAASPTENAPVSVAATATL